MKVMYLDIDRFYAINTLLKVSRKYKDALIRETEHGYHIYIPDIQCNPDNFIYCLVMRSMLGDDRNRIAMDIIRLGMFRFYDAFDVVFDIKVKKEKDQTYKIKGKWYNLREYLSFRGIK